MCLTTTVLDFVIFPWIGNVAVVKTIVNCLVSYGIWTAKQTDAFWNETRTRVSSRANGPWLPGKIMTIIIIHTNSSKPWNIKMENVQKSEQTIRGKIILFMNHFPRWVHSEIYLTKCFYMGYKSIGKSYTYSLIIKIQGDTKALTNYLSKHI